MIAMKRLKGLGWIALGFLAAIACYLVSLQVAIERNKLGDLNASILAANMSTCSAFLVDSGASVQSWGPPVAWAATSSTRS